jgi:alpha-galactosidase
MGVSPLRGRAGHANVVRRRTWGGAVSEWVLLRAAGTALLLDVGGPGLPRVVHWGADPGDLTTGQTTALALAAAPALANSGLDAPWGPSLVPSEADGWSGRPGLTG